MAFWVPYSDFKIGVEKKDILEYIQQVSANALPINPQKKDSTQQSFAYFIKKKMKLDYYQDAEIEVGFKSKKAAKKYLVKVGDEAPEEYTGKIDTEDSINLSGIDISGLDFEGVTFNSTDLNGVNFDRTFLHNSSILYTDLSGSETITKSTVNSSTTFPEGGLSAEQREQLKKKAKTAERLEYKQTDIQKELGDLDDPGTLGRALEIAKAFFLTAVPGVSLENHIRSTDKSFDVLRYHYLKTGDETLLNEVEQASKKHISQEIKSSLKDVTLHSPGYTSWLIKPNSEKYSEKIKQIVSNTIEEEIQKDGFLKKHFLIEIGAVRKTLMDKILTKDFIGEVKNAVDTLSSVSGSEKVKEVKRRIERAIVERVEEETHKWKESQTVGKEKWADLESLSKRKKFKKHIGVSPNSGSMATRALLPDWCSPLQPSSYPSIDPYDTEEILKDLALKKEGAEFLTKIGAAGTGASAGVLLSAFTSTGKITSAVASVAVTGLTSILSDSFLDSQFKYENHKDYDNKMGDKLLELGVIYRSMKPHIEKLGIGAVNTIALKYMGGTGYLQGTAQTYQNILSSAYTYMAYRDFYATKDCISKQSTEENTSARKRPGSNSFDLNLKHKLFSNSKFFTSLFVGAALLVVGIVLATSFPVAIPALTAFVTKGISLKVGAVAVGSFAATAGLTYLSYGAVSKGVDHIKHFVKSRSSKSSLAEQSDDSMKDKIKGADTIKRAFSNYKYRKAAEEAMSKKYPSGHAKKLLEKRNQNNASKSLKTGKYGNNTKSTKTRLSDIERQKQATQGTSKIGK